MSVSNSKIILGIGIFITVFMSVNLVKAIGENRKIQERINRLQSNVNILAEENQTLQDTFEYVQTDIFVEQEARNKLNYKKDGETVVSLPPEKVEVREVVEAEYQAALERQQKSNPQKWFDYFFATADASVR